MGEVNSPTVGTMLSVDKLGTVVHEDALGIVVKQQIQIGPVRVKLTRLMQYYTMYGIGKLAGKRFILKLGIAVCIVSIKYFYLRTVMR
jgi:hypothetical protein